MFRLIASLFLPALLLTGCSDSREVADELPNSSLAGAARADVSESRMDAPVARPVVIGEDGPRMDACGTLGQVTRSGSDGLALRAAPFADAKILAQLGEGQRAFVCTRSIDQKWLGVVVLPAAGAETDAPSVDCGVSSPVDRKQPYAGTCASGWVASAYVRLIGG